MIMTTRGSFSRRRALRCAVGALMGIGLLSAFRCSRDYYADYPDILLPAPSAEDLTRWVLEQADHPGWRGDPREVAHRAILSVLEVPWMHRPYRASEYEVRHDREDWGPYVVRGYQDNSGRITRYRVKMRAHKSIWYAIEVSHYIAVELPHPALEEE